MLFRSLHRPISVRSTRAVVLSRPSCQPRCWRASHVRTRSRVPFSWPSATVRDSAGQCVSQAASALVRSALPTKPASRHLLSPPQRLKEPVHSRVAATPKLGRCTALTGEDSLSSRARAAKLGGSPECVRGSAEGLGVFRVKLPSFCSRQSGRREILSVSRGSREPRQPDRKSVV